MEAIDVLPARVSAVLVLSVLALASPASAYGVALGPLEGLAPAPLLAPAAPAAAPPASYGAPDVPPHPAPVEAPWIGAVPSAAPADHPPMGPAAARASDAPGPTAPPTSVAPDVVGVTVFVDEALPLTPMERLRAAALAAFAAAERALARADGRDAEAAPAAPAPRAPRAPSSSSAEAAATSPAVGAAVLAATAAVALGWATGTGGASLAALKRVLAVLGVGGFTRLHRDLLLDHANRERLYALLRERPGASQQELVRSSGVGRTAVTYHLRVLEREGLARSERVGRRRLWFATGVGGPGRDESAALAALAHQTTRAVARGVVASPGLDQQALCRSLGLTPSLAHWHVERLEGAGVVTRVRDGRRVRYYPGPLAPRLLGQPSVA